MFIVVVIADYWVVVDVAVAIADCGRVEVNRGIP